METLPFYIPAGFIATTLLTLWFLYRASSYNRSLVIIAIIWLLVQGALTLTGFYQLSSGMPPRFMLLVLPPFILISILFLSTSGSAFFDQLNIQTLTLLHIARLPVELVLYGLFIHHAVPRLMTFEGGNLDILSGLSAPLIWYFGYERQKLSRSWLLAWNILAMLLLLNIVIRAIFSGPFAFQRFGFEQPAIALLHFPFSLLPAFVVPAVLLAHLASIRKFLQNLKK